MLELRPSSGPRLILQLSSHDARLEVRVIDSPVGEDAADIVLQRLEDVLRLTSQPTFHEDVGQGLFRALFPGRLAELYRAIYTQAVRDGVPLTVELRFDSDLVRIARYPWELLHDGTRFLLQSGAVHLARYMTFPEPPRPLTPRSPLEILVVSARPKDQPPLASEFEMLQQAFQALIGEKKLDLAYLTPPTWDTLMDWLLAGAPSILHFEGHGAFTRTGLLIFENPDGESDPVDAATLGGAFYGTDLRLAVLSACDSAKVAGESLLSSVAPSLILAGIPAVVAMQQRLPDEAATRFSRGFYTALLQGQDLETAVAAGRKQLMRSTFWYVPTLYLRSRKMPEFTRAYIERRIDSAGPRRAPINEPLRFGLWIRRTDSPVPSDEELRRLLGLEALDEVSRDETRARMQFPVEGGQFQPGMAEVRLIAPGCEIHTNAVKQVTVFADFDTPPVWFPLTPRRTGRVDITFEVSQNGGLIASVAHTLYVTPSAEGAPVAALKSYGPVVTPPPIPVDDGEAIHELPAPPAPPAPPNPTPDEVLPPPAPAEPAPAPVPVYPPSGYTGPIAAAGGPDDPFGPPAPPEDYIPPEPSPPPISPYVPPPGYAPRPAPVEHRKRRLMWGRVITLLIAVLLILGGAVVLIAVFLNALF